MPKIFRQVPPLELVERILESFGLRTINDKTWFAKPQINLPAFEEFLPELEPYYMPCVSATRQPTTQSRAITILRQILREHGSSIKTVEKSTGGKKQAWYCISNTATIIDATVTFS